LQKAILALHFGLLVQQKTQKNKNSLQNIILQKLRKIGVAVYG
jgi:hypothetical protein